MTASWMRGAMLLVSAAPLVLGINAPKNILYLLSSS